MAMKYAKEIRMSDSRIPEKNSKQWIKNEKLIAKNPVLRGARDTAEGFKPSSGITTGADVSQQYKDNYDKIDFSRRDPKEKKGFRVKINGRYVDEDQQDE